MRRIVVVRHDLCTGRAHTFHGDLMRATLVLGILLVLAGGYILVQGFSVTTDRLTMDMGPLHA